MSGGSRAGSGWRALVAGTAGRERLRGTPPGLRRGLSLHRAATVQATAAPVPVADLRGSQHLWRVPAAQTAVSVAQRALRPAAQIAASGSTSTECA